ncbi:uncharacterized protein LOC116193022 [Punica granatum]|uniref:Uncharacterized protein LOC116193022 n=2 Tax=Punica granatum TaxID=22663 RepID=A0A218X8J7_PUNGR|nr:uncharacterized protein LOC116193022 [Punica granatum]OWM80702.1 hypothetical protein CDL15_Pgr006732 [Punica granatum]
MTGQAPDRADAEMAEVEAASQQLSRGGEDAAREMLATARQLIDQGKPSQALQAVVMATRAKGGDEAVCLFLQRARDLYRTRIQSNAAIDQLASLFAECAIAEAEPQNGEPLPETMASNPSMDPDAQRGSILAETGRVQVVLDAFADGSSFICLQCGGLVSVHRKDEHYAYWCG